MRILSALRRAGNLGDCLVQVKMNFSNVVATHVCLDCHRG